MQVDSRMISVEAGWSTGNRRKQSAAVAPGGQGEAGPEGCDAKLCILLRAAEQQQQQQVSVCRRRVPSHVILMRVRVYELAATVSGRQSERIRMCVLSVVLCCDPLATTQHDSRTDPTVNSSAGLRSPFTSIRHVCVRPAWRATGLRAACPPRLVRTVVDHDSRRKTSQTNSGDRGRG